LSHIVLDASIILTWCFPDEDSQKAQEISERIANGGRAQVPAFWRHEIMNALLVGERRKRLTRALTKEFINDLTSFQWMSTFTQQPQLCSTRRSSCAGSTASRLTTPATLKSLCVATMPSLQSMRTAPRRD
jgi:hypothetical protein